MVDLKYLRSKGVSSGDYKKIFTADRSKWRPSLRRRVDNMAARVRDGRVLNLKEWKAYAAIDFAYDVPFSQTTATLVQNILSQKLDLANTRKALGDWGLSDDDLFIKIPTPEGGNMYQLNVPVFFQIFVPIVKSYVAIRLAKLFNERNVNPLLDYKPLKQTSRNEILCELVTDLVNTQSHWYGYPAVARQSMLQMLKYGTMIAFPREEWHCERQVVDGEVTTIKEGLRYVHPHPTRFYYDLRYPLTSINSDSGCEFAGHWHILSYGEILDNKMLWNRRSIFSGTNWFMSPMAGNYFSEFFPCQMNFPTKSYAPLQREDKANWYGTGDRDKMVFVTDHFEKIIPKDWGLADYKYPIWHRFTLAGDDGVIWAEPCAYTPAWFMGYDYDENAGRTPSFALECVPWQDHVGNLLSQMTLTAKQNLDSVIFYDTNLVDKKDIERMKNLGETRYRSRQFIGYDSMKMGRMGLNQANAFLPVNIQPRNIAELQTMLSVALNIMERVLQISAQEAGGQGSHQQSKFEVQTVGGATTNRAALTGSSVDEGIDAWKNQLYEANLAYRDPRFSAQVSADIPNVLEMLKELGFEVEHGDEEKLVVTGHKSKLRIESFTRSNIGAQQQADKEIAQTIFQVVGTVAGQPEIFKRIGAKNLVALIEQAAILAGVPRTFAIRLEPNPKDDKEVEQHVVEAIKQAQQATLKQVDEKVTQPIAKEMATDKQRLDQQQQILAQLQKIYDVAKAEQDKLAIKAKETQAEIQRRDAAEAANQRREDEATRREQARKDAEAQAQIQRDSKKADMELSLKVAHAHTDISNKKKVAEAKTKAK